MFVKGVVDIFSGAGGLSLGAKMSGLNSLFAVEFDSHASNTFQANHPESIVLNKDIKDVKPEEYIQKPPFILAGGPPCQGFSIANTKTRNLDNPNNWMFKEYIRFVETLKPAWFLFENVEGFKSFGKGEFAKQVEKSLSDLGYHTSSAVLNASDYGVPQNRNRYFIVGARQDVTSESFDFSLIEKSETKTSVHDALSDLPVLENGSLIDSLEYKHAPHSEYSKLMRRKSEQSLQNYVTKSKPHIIDRYKAISQGENWAAAKEKGLLETYSSTQNTHSGIYKRLIENKPSVTIANYRKSMLIHPAEHRGLSLREAARLQSFTDDYTFCGPLSYQQQQVGNAVPPLLAKAIFEVILLKSRHLSFC